MQDMQSLGGFSAISKCMTLNSYFTLNSGLRVCVIFFALRLSVAYFVRSLFFSCQSTACIMTLRTGLKVVNANQLISTENTKRSLSYSKYQMGSMKLNFKILQCSHRRRLHGAMGAIAPTAKKLWGRRPQVAPTGILLCQVFETVN